MALESFDIADEKMQRLARMVDLINNKSTGSLDEFASKVNLGKSRLSELIGTVKSTGVQVRYDRARRSYYFEDERKYTLQCRLVLKKVNDRNI
mgnify:CR=1 FL=1